MTLQIKICGFVSSTCAVPFLLHDYRTVKDCVNKRHKGSQIISRCRRPRKLIKQTFSIPETDWTCTSKHLHAVTCNGCVKSTFWWGFEVKFNIKFHSTAKSSSETRFWYQISSSNHTCSLANISSSHPRAGTTHDNRKSSKIANPDVSASSVRAFNFQAKSIKSIHRRLMSTPLNPSDVYRLLIPCNHHSLSLPAPIGILMESLGKELPRPSAYIVVKALPTLPKACQIINRKQKLARQPFNKGWLPRFSFCWTGSIKVIPFLSHSYHSI